jgi:hypothetical protein
VVLSTPLTLNHPATARERVRRARASILASGVTAVGVSTIVTGSPLQSAACQDARQEWFHVRGHACAKRGSPLPHCSRACLALISFPDALHIHMRSLLAPFLRAFSGRSLDPWTLSSALSRRFPVSSAYSD